MPFVDTHTHLYLPEFDADRTEVMERAIASGVEYFILPNIDVSSLLPLKSLYEAFPKHCRMLFGLHPCSVKENWEEELQRIFSFAESVPYSGIGEIGLDFYWDTTFKKEQFRALERQLQKAVVHNLPVSLHTRNALDETIEMVQSFPLLRGVFHCFSGTEEQAKKILRLENFYFGIGGVLTFKNSALREVLNIIPPERIVLETDAPYLTPVPFRGKRNEPSFLSYILQELSKIYADNKNLENLIMRQSIKVFGITTSEPGG